MINENVSSPSKDTATGSMICLLLLIGIGILSIQMGNDLTPILVSILSSSFLYFIYYIFHTGQHLQIISGIIVSLLLMCIAAIIPFIGPIILVIWIIYNISMSLQSIKNIIPDAIWSLFLYTPLLMAKTHNYHSYSTILHGIYFVSSFFYCGWLVNMKLDTRTTLFKFSIMWMSVPIIGILIVSIISSLRSAFNIKANIESTTIKTPQQVSSHFRGDTFVNTYTRQVNQTVTTVATKALPGIGAITASSVNSLSKATDLTSLTVFDNEDLTTKKDINFYRYDDIDNKKISNFINEIDKISYFPKITSNDVIFYYDETVFGKGNHGVVITSQYVIYNNGKLYKPFFIPINSIARIIISGILNKTISIQTTKKDSLEIELTQSNKGADLLFKALQTTTSQLTKN